MIAHQPLELLAGVLGGFNRSLQHPTIGVCDEDWKAAVGSIWARAIAITGAAGGVRTR
jgi:hypothetical protein